MHGEFDQLGAAAWRSRSRQRPTATVERQAAPALGDIAREPSQVHSHESDPRPHANASTVNTVRLAHECAFAAGAIRGDALVRYRFPAADGLVGSSRSARRPAPARAEPEAARGPRAPAKGHAAAGGVAAKAERDGSGPSARR